MRQGETMSRKKPHRTKYRPPVKVPSMRLFDEETGQTEEITLTRAGLEALGYTSYDQLVADNRAANFETFRPYPGDPDYVPANLAEYLDRTPPS